MLFLTPHVILPTDQCQKRAFKNHCWAGLNLFIQCLRGLSEMKNLFFFYVSCSLIFCCPDEDLHSLTLCHVVFMYTMLELLHHGPLKSGGDQLLVTTAALSLVRFQTNALLSAALLPLCEREHPLPYKCSICALYLVASAVTYLSFSRTSRREINVFYVHWVDTGYIFPLGDDHNFNCLTV